MSKDDDEVRCEGNFLSPFLKEQSLVKEQKLVKEENDFVPSVHCFYHRRLRRTLLRSVILVSIVQSSLLISNIFFAHVKIL